MRLPPLLALRAFEAAARHGGFARAGTDIGLTPAAVSQHVRALEDWLGQPLFVRHPRGVRLTLAGHELGEAATRGLELIAVAVEGLRRERGEQRLRLACIASVATRWLTPRLAGFRAVHPDLRLHVVYARDGDTPETTGADLTIRHGVQPSGRVHRLLPAATRPTCSPRYLETVGPLRDPQDLLRADLLHDKTPEAWAGWFRAAGVRGNPPAGILFEEVNLMTAAVLSGDGVGLCPTSLIGGELARGEVVQPFELAADEEKSYWLIEADRLSLHAQRLSNWLLEQGASHGLPTPGRCPGLV